jgi:hypothetical protein
MVPLYESKIMTEEVRRKILVETVQRFGKQEWFRDAVLYDKHPSTGETTLEIKVNYLPLFEKKEVINFALEKNVAYRFTVVDRAGNPSE